MMNGQLKNKEPAQVDLIRARDSLKQTLLSQGASPEHINVFKGLSINIYDLNSPDKEKNNFLAKTNAVKAIDKGKIKAPKQLGIGL